MTWQNALFVIAGVSLMGFLEWAHHRFDLWLSEEKGKATLLYLGALLILIAGIVIVIFALKMK